MARSKKVTTEVIKQEIKVEKTRLEFLQDLYKILVSEGIHSISKLEVMISEASKQS